MRNLLLRSPLIVLVGAGLLLGGCATRGICRTRASYRRFCKGGCGRRHGRRAESARRGRYRRERGAGGYKHGANGRC